jgi:4-alpha-glucanotransferase
MSDRRSPRFSVGRHAGVLVPLFSIPSRRSWGIGEIPDLVLLARWMRACGLDFVQLLPVNEMQEGQSSPYSALSAMAIDPIFIAVDQIDEWAAAGTADVLGPEGRAVIARARDAHDASPESDSERRVNYAAVRAVKNLALRHAFRWFEGHVRGTGDRRDGALRAFEERERWWLDDYALFRALHDEQGGLHWREWEPALRDREPAALAAARERLDLQIRYYSYLQWIADEQWQRARIEASPIGFFGDFPFMVSGHSADVWARQHEFDLDRSVGTPPDAFSATGQDWGLPPYRWDVVRETDYGWLRERAQRAAELYDGFRIDHVIGFYRTYVRRPEETLGSFVPPDEPSQRAQGERLLSVFGECGSTVIAEDLGTVPDFVRESLAQRHCPGMKVLRWERDWQAADHPFHDPPTYHTVSVATSGTHDTETLAEWWDAADAPERQALLALPFIRDAGVHAEAPFSNRTRDALLETLFGAGSDLLILPIQDIFGWRDRINTPALVNAQNWTWRLPIAVEDLIVEPQAVERASFVHGLSEKYGRC